MDCWVVKVGLLRGPLVVLAASLLTGCPRTTTVRIVGQAAPGRPVFASGGSWGGPPTGISFLMVAPCAPPGAEPWDPRPRPLWGATRDPTPDAPPPQQLTYGVLPAGYDVVRGAPRPGPGGVPPLPPGCYTAETDGTGWLKFQVARDGSVLETANYSR